MNVSSKEIKRSYRDLNSIVNDLLSTDEENYINLAKRFVSFINCDKIIYRIVEPLLNYKVDEQKYLKKYTEHRYEIIVPADINEHIAFVLSFFSVDLMKENFSLLGFLVNYVSTPYNDHLNKFNRNIIEPALRELLVKIEDFIEDEIIESQEYELGDINIFHIGSVNNQNGNIAIGKNIQIQQQSSIDKLPDEFAKALLQNGFTLKELDALREDIEELKELLKQPKPDGSKIKIIFKKVLNITGDVMVGVLANIISRPEITSSIIASL